ncbi:hypothetical protein HK107_09380 [Parvularcula sp. ZS-1/3]|uniref:Uncharacterized protein n=1 Tax=Parvularcula mediterranea TaxID=2732508 RepID=A0A7Y3RMV0_9PROT|nr:hypothetical protein [Parvularcula mediterranea]NNU16530.1 hypothetical protein [Parvularcula mediterranea]
MILRRLTEHVRAQNWLAVGIDFVIVVVGVFIGIQVSNWNEVRQQRVEEAALIERLRVDFRRIGDDGERSRAFHESMVSDFRTLIEAVREGSFSEEDLPAIERALAFGDAFQTSADHSGTFTELLSSGRANLLQDKQLLDLLVEYQDFLERFAVARDFFIGRSEVIQVSFSRHFSLDMSWALTEAYADPTEVGTGIGAIDFQGMTDDPAFENAAEEYYRIHNYFTMWRLRIDARVDAILERLEEAQR